MAARTIEQALREAKTRGDNFDALRLAAAACVIVSHSFEIVGGAGAAEPLRILTRGDASLGKLAVMTFFAISGFLLTVSLRREPRLATFARKRLRRIAPGLAACVFACALVLGPALSALTPGDYFSAAETWRYLANAGFYTGFKDLPGVFETPPISGVVNGPLWTLKFEIMCYATLAAAAALGMLKAWAGAVAYLVFSLVHALLDPGPHVGVLYYLHQYTDLARPFVAGALFALLSTKIALTRLGVLASLAGLLAAAPAGVFSDAFPLFGGYLALAAAFAPLGPLADAGRHGDFSYGLYLWGWPAQQIVQTAIAPPAWWGNAAIALPLALGMAILSWTTVERPALARARRAAR
jgi:peptidoglycan/LPS O-acetylase OafA/YrhL